MEATLGCPRCNYDQSGVIDSWTDACPLHGNCSECGLELNWADIVKGRVQHMPHWYVERGGWSLPLKSVKTLGASVHPLWFWRKVHIEHPVHFAKLVLYVVYALGFAVIAGGVVCGGLTLIHTGKFLPYSFAGIVGPAIFFETQYDTIPIATADSSQQPWWMGAAPTTPSVVFEIDEPMLWIGPTVMLWIWVGMPLAVPLMYFLFSDSLKLSSVRLAHLARATVIWTAVGVFVAHLVLALQYALIYGDFVSGYRSAWIEDETSISIYHWTTPVLVLMLVVFWWSVAKHYLRLRMNMVSLALLFLGAAVISVAMSGGVALVGFGIHQLMLGK